MTNKYAKEKQFIDAYNAYSPAISNYCYYRVFDKEKTKDFVQETFCRTWKYILAGNEIINIRAFLYRTARNLIIDQGKKMKSCSLDQIMEKGFSPSTDPRQNQESYYAAQDVLTVIHSLDKKYGDVIVLKYINDLSTKEIALALHETENNVYVRMSRGVSKVKKIMLDQKVAVSL